jgi:hypothetical protein
MLDSIILFVEVIDHDGQALYQVFALEVELLCLLTKIIDYFQKGFFGEQSFIETLLYLIIFFFFVVAY